MRDLINRFRKLPPWKKLRIIVLVLLPIYIFVVLWLTLLNRTPGIRRSMLSPFWEYRALFRGRTLYWLGQIGGNLIMLLPLGFCLPTLLHKFRFGIFTVLFCCAFSVLIEITQFFTGLGLMEFDDVFNNTCGAAVGFVLWRVLYSLKIFSQNER